MFINRIFTRVHKFKNSVTINNNVLLNNNHRQIPSNSVVIRNNVYYTSKRNLSSTGWRKTTVEKFKLSDSIPENYELIYRSTMASYLVAAQISASIGIVAVFSIAIINYFTEDKADYFINVPDVELFNIEDVKLQMMIFTAGFILFNVAIMLFVSKFPVRIYFDPKSNKFIGVFFGIIPKKKNLIAFKAGEVTHTPKNSVIPWSEFRYKLKSGQNLVMLDHYFRKPDDINIMLGYTKL